MNRSTIYFWTNFSKPLFQLSELIQGSDKNSDTDNDIITAAQIRPSIGHLEERLMATAYYK